MLSFLVIASRCLGGSMYLPHYLDPTSTLARESYEAFVYLLSTVHKEITYHRR